MSLQRPFRTGRIVKPGNSSSAPGPAGLVTAGLLLGAAVLCYGLWIPKLGLYGNDLAYLYYYHLLGAWGPGLFASIDRPASALFYAITTGVLGESLWPYHIFLLLLRWLSGVLLVWVLRLVWPERQVETAVAGLLFVVYPGFRQNPIAVEFILHFAVLDLFLLSLGAGLRVARLEQQNREYWRWLVLTAVGAAGLFWAEYFIGLEILRPVLLWIVTRRSGLTGRVQWRRVLLAWLPALAVAAAFVFWRVFIFAFPTYQPVLLENFAANPLAALAGLATAVVRDLHTAVGLAWRQTLDLPDNRTWLPIWLAVIAAGFSLTLAALWFLTRRKPARQKSRTAQTLPAGLLIPTRFAWGARLAGIGIIAMLAGGVPFWVAGIPVTVEFPWDRSTLAFLLGASLLVAGLLAVLPLQAQAVLAAGLVALAGGTHFLNAQEYHQEWRKLQNFAWQLTWRVPGLEPGTLVLFDTIPLNRYSDNDLTALLNWTYAPEHTSRQIPYKSFDLTIRLDEAQAGLPGLEKNLPVEHNHRGLFFKTTTSQSLALDYNPPGCLMLPGPQEAGLPGLSDGLRDALTITNLDQVRAEGSARPPAVLGPEPEHGWCYFYQKASLAIQQGDDQSAAVLGDQARAAGLQAARPVEMLPFIKGYAQIGRWEQAQAWTEQAVLRSAGSQQDMAPTLCALWAQFDPNNGSGGQSAVAAVKRGLGCLP